MPAELGYSCRQVLSHFEGLKGYTRQELEKKMPRESPEKHNSLVESTKIR